MADDDWFSFDEGVKPAEIVHVDPEEKGIARDLPHDKWLEKKQRQLFSDAAAILEPVLQFNQIDPKSEAPPDEWTILYGERGALERWRVAKAAWLSPKEAPIGIKVAKDIAVGISKSIAAEKGGPKVLNMQFVTVARSKAPALYPEEEVDS